MCMHAHERTHTHTHTSLRSRKRLKKTKAMFSHPIIWRGSESKRGRERERQRETERERDRHNIHKSHNYVASRWRVVCVCVRGTSLVREERESGENQPCTESRHGKRPGQPGEHLYSGEDSLISLQPSHPVDPHPHTQLWCRDSARQGDIAQTLGKPWSQLLWRKRWPPPAPGGDYGGERVSYSSSLRPSHTITPPHRRACRC